MVEDSGVASIIRSNFGDLWRRFSGVAQPDMSAAAAPAAGQVKLGSHASHARTAK